MDGKFGESGEQKSVIATIDTSLAQHWRFLPLMKIVLQRCLSASVGVEGETVGQIGAGLVLFVGIAQGDDETKLAKLTGKIPNLRLFNNDEGRFDRSLRDVGGAVLAISNFTLLGSAHKGTRPSFSQAAAPDEARELFERFVTLLRAQDVPVETGIFGADMKVSVENDGPVTMILEM